MVVVHDSGDIKRVLIVDREIAAAEAIRQTLSDGGFCVSTMTDSLAVLAAVSERPPDLVLIDWDMPGVAALGLLQAIRHARTGISIRLIILSAYASEQDVIRGLALGADDYIAKPFSLREVLARSRAVLRLRGQERESEPLSCDQLVLDSVTKRVTARGRPVGLRQVEYRLLEFLMSNPGTTFNRRQLLAHVWGDDTDVDERTVDVNVQRLRRVLGEPDAGCEGYVRTVRGLGYCFGSPLQK
jgi:two-component system, OmpR family, phosphate regulon response regulator PhoB